MIPIHWHAQVRYIFEVELKQVYLVFLFYSCFHCILGAGGILSKLLKVYYFNLPRIGGRHDLEKKVNDVNLFTKFNY